MRVTRPCERCKKKKESYDFIKGIWVCPKCDKIRKKREVFHTEKVVNFKERSKTKDYKNHEVWGL